MDIKILQSASGVKFKTLEPIHFEYLGRRFTVPTGFESDGMSTPRFLWRFIDPAINGRALIPSIIHDYLYQYNIGTRKQADQYYRDRLIANKYSKAKAHIIYAGLRLFGWTHYKRKEE